MKDNFIQILTLTIFRLASKNGPNYLAEMEKELAKLVDLLNSNDDLFLLLNHPQIPLAEKFSIIDKLITNPLSIKTVQTIIKYKRLSSLSELHHTFLVLMKVNSNTIDAEVKLPWEPSEAEQAEIKKAVENYSGKKKVDMKLTIDPALIGGVYLKLNNLIIDYSIKKELKEFEERLTKQ